MSVGAPLRTVPAWELIGHYGRFRLPGGRTFYEAVMWDEASARSDRPRLARISPGVAASSSGLGLHQVNRWVDWDQQVEVFEDLDDLAEGEPDDGKTLS